MQGVLFMEAPGEGEAMCAALTAAGVADLVWTNDIIDTLVHGATGVLTFTAQSYARQQMLDYKFPHKSTFKVVTTSAVRDRFELAVRLDAPYLCLDAACGWVPMFNMLLRLDAPYLCLECMQTCTRTSCQDWMPAHC